MGRLVPTARDKFALELMWSTPEFFLAAACWVCGCDSTHVMPSAFVPVMSAYCARCDQAAVVFLQGEGQ